MPSRVRDEEGVYVPWVKTKERMDRDESYPDGVRRKSGDAIVREVS